MLEGNRRFEIFGGGMTETTHDGSAHVEATRSGNKATEIIGGKVETVEVSKHPDPTIPETELSLADIERSKSHPKRWIAYIIGVLIAVVAPYGAGRMLAVGHTAWVVEHFNVLTPQGMAFVSWTATLAALTCLGLAVVDSAHWLWRILFAFALAAEQFIAGLALLRFDFWYSTYVVYGSASSIANAANLGIIAAGLAVAAFIVVWIGLLVVIRKDSPLNVLTRSWASFIMFFAFEACALLIVLFGGLLGTV